MNSCDKCGHYVRGTWEAMKLDPPGLLTFCNHCREEYEKALRADGWILIELDIPVS